MTDVILLVLIVGIVGGVIFYIRRQKKKGAVCIGCPHAGSCGGSCGCHKGPLV